MPTLTTHVGKDSAGMKLVGFPNEDKDLKSSGGGVAYNGKHKARL